MIIKQYAEPQSAFIGQRLILKNLDGFIGFYDESSQSFVNVPQRTKFRMRGVVIELRKKQKNPDGDFVEILNFSGGSSFKLSEIKLLSPLEITFMPGEREPTGAESTDETENISHSVSHPFDL